MKQINPFLIFVFIVLLFMINGCKKETITTVKSFDGVSINFDNEGKGEPVIILVHGWSNTKSIWKTQVSHFSKKYRVIAVDLPGFGKSGNNRSEWTIASYGEDISSIIQQLNLKKVVLVGFSLGAPIVIEAANKVPDHVIGVVLVDELLEVEMQIPPRMAYYRDPAGDRSRGEPVIGALNATVSRYPTLASGSAITASAWMISLGTMCGCSAFAGRCDCTYLGGRRSPSRSGP